MPVAGGYLGHGAKGESPRGQRGGPGGDQAAARWCQGAVPAPFTPVAGRWLQGRRKRQRLGGEGFRMECGTGRTSAQTCPRRSTDELGRGIGQGRQDSRLAEASATAGISGPSTPLGGGDSLNANDKNVRARSQKRWGSRSVSPPLRR